MNTHHIQAVNGKETVTASPELKDFQLFKKESSNVEYFGTNHETGQLFIQFLSGGSYVHSNLPAELLKGMENADSIGKYYSANIRFKKEYEAEKVNWTIN